MSTPSKLIVPESEENTDLVEISPYENELLLRGKIGVSAGKPQAQPQKKEEEKEEKEEKTKTQKKASQSEKPKKKYDILEREHAQIMKININNKLNAPKE